MGTCIGFMSPTALPLRGAGFLSVPQIYHDPSYYRVFAQSTDTRRILLPAPTCPNHYHPAHTVLIELIFV